MSPRPEIPNGDKYRLRSDLSTECASLIMDLINRDHMIRTEGEGKSKAALTYSEVYEAELRDSDNGELLPAVRVRSEVSERVKQPALAGERISSRAVMTKELVHSFQAYTLELGELVDAAELKQAEDYSTHDMFEWTPLVTAVIEKIRIPKQETDDLPDDEFNEVKSHVVFTDNGRQPDDMELMRLIHLLQSILYTARESAAYEPSQLPSSTLVQTMGDLSFRNFSARDATYEACDKCYKADVPCIHDVGQDINHRPSEG